MITDVCTCWLKCRSDYFREQFMIAVGFSITYEFHVVLDSQCTNK